VSLNLLSVLAEDGEVLLYRPRLRQLTGSVTSAIFLGRVVFWRYKMKRPFYKFREPPGKGHPAYKQGDSWAEELGFGPRELRSAIMATSGIVRPGRPRPNTLLWRWTTRDRLTFWDVNAAVLAKGLEAVYFPNGQNDHYQNDEPAVTKWMNRPAEIISTTIKTNSTNKPVAGGDGKPGAERSENNKLSFVYEFGLVWAASHARLLPESRAVAILRHEGIEDAGEARRIIAEWAAMAARSSDCDPVGAFVWACHNRLASTEDGDQRLPTWS